MAETAIAAAEKTFSEKQMESAKKRAEKAGREAAAAEMSGEMEALKAQIAALTELMAKKSEEAVSVAPQAAVLTAPEDKYVTVFFAGLVSNMNEFPLGRFGVIIGNGSRRILKNDWLYEVSQLPHVRAALEARSLIVMDGLAEDERIASGTLYKKGEVLDEKAFRRFLDFEDDEAAGYFKMLCRSNRELIGGVFRDAYESGDNRIRRDGIIRMNDISKGDYEDGEGVFTPILRSMGDNF